ncbi:hypothetical protein ACLBX9_16565 [Methylobacterium sp. A49B]
MAIELVGDPIPLGGAPGPANVLTIGTVTTGAPGSQALAQVNGTSPAQTLDLTIPQGPVGATGLTPWAPIVAWAPSLICVASAPATTVYVGGTAYVCTASHLAGTFAADLAAGKWAPIAPGGLQPWKTQPVAWAASIAYSATAPADVVTNGGGCYVCSTAHTSGASFDATKWTQIAAPGSVVGALLAANSLSELASNPAAAQANLAIAFTPVRQTVLSGPAASGVPSFLPATSASLTLAFQGLAAASPLAISAAAGFSNVGAVNLVALITANPSLTLAASSTLALFYDFVSAAVATAGFGSGALFPIYQFGGAISTVNGQFTFDIQAMQGWLGNGSAAVKCNRVYIGEAVTSASAVTSAIAYAYQGRYVSAIIGSLANSTTYPFSHNIGVPTDQVENIASSATSASGPWFSPAQAFSGSYAYNAVTASGRNTASFVTGSNGTFASPGATGATNLFMRSRRTWGGS